jgi:hypothetical protein
VPRRHQKKIQLSSTLEALVLAGKGLNAFSVLLLLMLLLLLLQLHVCLSFTQLSSL